jgi:hypothetical protein
MIILNVTRENFDLVKQKAKEDGYQFMPFFPPERNIIDCEVDYDDFSWMPIDRRDYWEIGDGGQYSQHEYIEASEYLGVRIIQCNNGIIKKIFL